MNKALALAYMPEDIYNGLSSEELGQLEQVLMTAKAMGSSYTFDLLMDEIMTDNKGLNYLALATPWKYTILEKADEDFVVDLLAWDAKHLDLVHTEFQGGSVNDRLFDQRLSALGAVLQNKNISYNFAYNLIVEVAAEWPTSYEDNAKDAFGSLLDHVLRDKWSIYEYTDEVMQAVHNYLSSVGLNDAAQQYTEEAKLEYMREWDEDEDDEDA